MAGLFKAPPTAVWLEIGFGGGEHLAAQALRHPEVGFIGAEPFRNGVASLVAHVRRLDLANVRIFDNDVRQLLPVLPEAGIGRAFLLFPDPWPKRRHADRRFTGPANLAAMARCLADGAEFRIATDDVGYVRWTLQWMQRQPEFRWRARSARDWRQPPADWVETRYQQKAARQGRPAYFLCYERVARKLAETLGEDPR